MTKKVHFKKGKTAFFIPLPYSIYSDISFVFKRARRRGRKNKFRKWDKYLERCQGKGGKSPNKKRKNKIRKERRKERFDFSPIGKIGNPMNYFFFLLTPTFFFIVRKLLSNWKMLNPFNSLEFRIFVNVFPTFIKTQKEKHSFQIFNNNNKGFLYNQVVLEFELIALTRSFGNHQPGEKE